jgi:hypothetical protein
MEARGNAPSLQKVFADAMTVRERTRGQLIDRDLDPDCSIDDGEAGSAMQTTNAGRRQFGAPALDRETLERMLGTSAPTARQMLGKDRALYS